VTVVHFSELGCPSRWAERGADPKVPKLQRRLLNAIRAFTSPLLPDDYLELINPLWSTRELRGRIESIEAETPDAATVLIRPGYEWEGHQAGQYLRIGLDINGRRHWRAYSLTSDPGRSDGFISITIKNVDVGVVSPYLVRRGRPGSIVSLGGVEGEFVLPDPLPEKLLFISAGSGITPIMSMLRSLEHQEALDDVLLIHSARTPDDVIFGEQLHAMEERNEGFRVHKQLTGEMGRFKPADLERLCPDWKEREAFISGPAELLDALDDHWDAHGDCDCLHMERFQPIIGEAEEGEGGTINFLKSDREAHSDGSKPILVAGEDAGLTLPFGCREGICHTCVGELKAGEIRDLRTGKVSGQRGEMVRTCINAPEGPVEIEL
jgi:stearoyl-CoA 9-desaturase NADPH oxidoreductase